MPALPSPKRIDFATADVTVLLSDRAVQQLLDLVDTHPEWSIEEMVIHHPSNIDGQKYLTYQDARIILGRLHLSTILQRKIRQAKTQEWEQSNKEYTQKLLSQTIPDFFSYIKHRKEYQQYQWQTRLPTLPQTKTIPVDLEQRYRGYEKFIYLSKLFGLAFLAAFVFLISGSFVFDTIFQAVGFLGKIGMFFAFSALFFGVFFFLYSLKYYITVALVLSYSRDSKDVSNSGKSWSSLFRKIFGVSIEVSSEVETGHKPSLSYDLETIQLERNPFVSIHVGTYNEKRVIDRFLLAATSLDYDNYEVIVADDSTDETVQLLGNWAKHPKVKISHRNTRSGYKGAALKEALKKVDPRTEYILIFDADFIPYPDSITQFLKYFQSMLGSLDPAVVRESPIAAVQGYQWHILNKSENWITRGVRTEYSGSYIIERSGEELYRGMKQISGSVYMIRSDVLRLVDWGVSITEDFELTLKLYQKGFKVVYTPYIQTPAEAVSTIKRLIRQRMRWAEGHSFNVKKMFKQLLSSNNLTFSEKFEFIYFAPYYLQAFFFLLGTFCWFTAEVLFQVKLPFWTEVWGWSLVFTNLLSIPLMNSVGLFMEESEEKDYLGLFSFIVLSYIVAPFQAFAAVKGFLEKEEGPWFRTPKTGRITDNFVPGRFYRFVRGILGQPSKLSSFAIQSPSLPIPFQFATVKNVPSFKNKYKWTGKSVIAFCLLVTVFLNYLTFFAPKAEAAWYNNNYLYKKSITINHNKVTGNTPATTVRFMESGTDATHDMSFWTTSGTHDSSDCTTAETGSCSIQMNSGNPGDYAFMHEANVAADSGTRISFYMKFDNFTTDGNQNIIELWDSTDSNYVYDPIALNGSHQLCIDGTCGATVLATGVWYRFALAYTITSTAVNHL
jgi:cellulose synthase/poly-beta-1,6-N-acetylglucosamine synthase-like glycosyltransferase